MVDPPNDSDYIVEAWQQVDLSALSNVSQLHFTMDSTDVSDGVMSTPTYFGIDEISFSVVPEPGSGLLGVWGCLLWAAASRTRRER